MSLTRSRPSHAAPAPSFFEARRSFFDGWFVLLMAGIACWLISVSRIDTTAVHHFGLVDVLPITFYIGIGLVAVSIIGELHSREVSRVLLACQFVALIVMIHGTVPLIYPEPRYSWVYKHFGVTEYIDVNGSVNTDVDIYQNWPVFFSLTAWLDRVAGVGNPRAYAEWAQVYFNLCYLVLLTFLYRSLTSNVRVVGLALLTFFSSSWVAQDYFAPQAFAFLFTLAAYGVILRYLGNDEANNRFIRFFGRVFKANQNGIRVEEQPPLLIPSARARLWGSIALALFAYVMVASHQLTPYLVLAGVLAITLLNFVRLRVIIIVGVIAIGYLVAHFEFIESKYGLFTTVDPLANSRNATIAADQGVAGRVLTGQAARALSGLVIVLAVLGFFRRLHHGKQEFLAGALMVAPVVVFFGQSYGGEAIYRVYLFALPWAALLAGYLLEPIGKQWLAVRGFVNLVPVFVMLALLMPAYYGLEEVNEVRPSEVAAVSQFYDTAQPGAVLMTIAPNFPLRSDADYARFALAAGGDFTPSLIISEPRFSNRALVPGDADAIADVLASYGGTNSYLALSASQRVYTDVYEILAPGSFATLDAAIAASPRWKVFFREGETVIYELIS